MFLGAIFIILYVKSINGNPTQWKNNELLPWKTSYQDVVKTTPIPIFEVTAASIVTKPGGDVILPCRIRNLGDKLVSWIRTKDLHIISSSQFVFTSDSRFSLDHPEGDSASWNLRIKNTRPSDQGLYECQINTEPKYKQAIMLTISETELGDSPMEIRYGSTNRTISFSRILGPREQLVNRGSTVTLTCEVRSNAPFRHNSTMPVLKHYVQPTNRRVDWLFEGHLLNYQSLRENGIYIDTDHSVDGNVLSHLTLSKVNNDDTGRYTCRAPEIPPVVVTLIVIDGTFIEAIQEEMRSQSSCSPTFSNNDIYKLTLLVFVQLRVIFKCLF